MRPDPLPNRVFPAEADTTYYLRGSIALPCEGVTTSEGEACVELNLAPSADSTKYSSNVVGETTCCIREHGVSVSSQRKRTLRVTRNCIIRMIEEIVGFGPKRNLRVFR